MKIYMAILLGLLSHACQSQPVKEILHDENQYLVSAESVSTADADQLKKNYGPLSAFIKNGYTAYRVTYKTTDFDGKHVVASGAVFIPDIKGPLPLLNYNHGTYFPSRERNAPSYLHGSNPELNIGKLFSGAGYLVVMPDYNGYGSTKNISHSYGAYNFIAASVIDMLQAVKELCFKQNVELSGKYFFSGWSEGAAVALATVKTLEEKHKGEFTPAVSVVNAGPYYSSAFINFILDAPKPLRHMNTYVWVLQSYNRVYKVNKPNAYYFNEPAATDLTDDPEADISHDPKKLFTETFRKNYKEGRDSALQHAMMENDLWDWRPASKIVFCHGDEDDFVPLFNSEKAYTAMKALGADVSLRILKGQTHSSGAFYFLQQAFTTFENAR